MSRRYYRRRFLNKRGYHAGAYVLAEVAVVRSGRADTSPSVDAELVISDCGRVAVLDFYAHDPASARNALHKARLLQEVVTGFADALEAAVEETDVRR